MNYVVLCLWALCLSVAWIGTGWQILRLLDFAEISWPLSGVVGLSAFIFVGGFLNLASLVHRPSLIVMVTLGDILFLAALATSRIRMSETWVSFMQHRWYVRGLAAVYAAILIGLALESLTFDRFNKFDDLASHLTSPGKLIQLGSLPFDPFSERRVILGLGGNFFLQSFMLVAGDVRSMWFIDEGIGLVLFAGCIYATGRRLGNTVAVCLGLTFLVLIVPLSHTNLTMTTLPAAIFTAFFLIETSDSTPAVSRSVMMALLAAAVTLLKSTYLPLALLILLWLHIQRIHERAWTRAIREALITAVAFLLVMLPWMVDMKRKEGTFLYPLLGNGYEIAAYGPVPHLISAGLYPLEVGLAILLPCAALAAAHRTAARGLPYADKISMMIFASGLVALIISIASGGASLSRYTKPFLLTFALILLASVARIPALSRPTNARRSILAACATALILSLVPFGKGDRDFIFLQHLFLGQKTVTASDQFFYVLTDDVMKREKEREARLQSTIPPGQAVYASYLPTYAMDFQRNNIFIADFPGMSSLPPGMPTQGPPTALRSYLLSKSIRYLAYSRKLTSEADEVVNFPPKTPGKSWPVMEGLNAADVDRQIISLGGNYHVIYDDGDERVIDLL